MISYIKNLTSRYKNLLACLFFILLAIITMGANPLAKETVGPFDLLASYSGYSSIAPSHLKIRSVERSDILDAKLPVWRKVKKEFYSSLQNFKNKKFYFIENLYGMLWNPSLFLYICIPNDPLAFYFSQLIKLIIAAFGTYLFLKLFLSYPASLFGGIVYMLCGFNAAWFFWPHVETSMWIPWLFWAVALYLIYNRTRYLFLITLITVFLIKGAFPPVAAYGLYSVALLILIYNIFNQKKVDSFFLKSFTPLLFIAFGFLISSDYLLNFVDTFKNVDLSYRMISFGSLSLNKLSNLYSPEETHVETSVYSGILAFIFSILSFLYLWIKKKFENWKSFYIFSVLLLVISIVITYGLITPNLIRKLPVFSSNPLRRVSLIIGLSIALLSAFFIEFIFSLRKRPSKVFKFVIPLLIILFVAQFMDQKKYFNEFNGPTPSEYFYPITPSIKYVKKNIKDYQSIIADYSFNISGTLSSYSFFEWFAHSFKTKKEKKLLSFLAPNSSISPTSFVILGRNIDFSSPLMNLFSVKYIFVHPKSLIFVKDPCFFKQPGLSHTPSPPLPFNSLCQHFYISESRHLSGINLFLGNYRNERFDSDVLLKVYDSRNNKLIGISEKDKRYIKDNTLVYFDFEKPLKLKKGEYKFSIELSNKRTHSMLSGWSTKRTKKIKSYLTVNGKKTDLSFKYFLHEASDRYIKRYRVHRMESTVALLENLKCPGGPYLISNIDKYPPIVKKRHLKYKSSLKDLTINLPKNSSGYVIIPRPYDNYMAYVDGELKDTEKYLGVMPAIHVDNNKQLFIRKKPCYLKPGFIISFVSLLFLVTLLFFKRKSKNW